jgi:hypothetical protein
LTHSIQMRGCQLLKSDQPLDAARGISEEHLCPVAHLCPRSESKWSICVRLSHISGAATRGTARCVLVYMLVFSVTLSKKCYPINMIGAHFVSRSRSRTRDGRFATDNSRIYARQRAHLCPVSRRVAHWCPAPPTKCALVSCEPKDQGTQATLKTSQPMESMQFDAFVDSDVSSSPSRADT